jgi:aspartate-semialdehyde dehydrogenase
MNNNKIPVAILGATGMVGQKYIQLLENHPMFEVVCVCASAKSSGQKYIDVVGPKWQMRTAIPDSVAHLKINDVFNIREVSSKCRLVFSCFEIDDKDLIQKVEFDYAKTGMAVVSNASANRSNDLVPMLIPEINLHHLDLIHHQQKINNLPKSGMVIVKPNCSIQSFTTPIFALEKEGFKVSQLIVSTLQALSGAGYPGVASLDVIDNIVPFIGGEEKKTEEEPVKILSKATDTKLVLRTDLKISATCTRVPVVDGHTALVSMKFEDKIPTEQEIKDIWNNFRSDVKEFELPSSPAKAIKYIEIENRPQPRKDRDRDKGMTCTVGRLRKCNVLDYKFVGLSHNTVRGAAGGGILNAEVLVAKGLVK